jgi:very-short-patch-repair endonuclease
MKLLFLIKLKIMDYWLADFFYGATPEIFKKAAILRKNMTFTEKLLWDRLKAKQINGYRFRAQHPINYYIADFYCHKIKLVIEIDGDEHEKKDNKAYDYDREMIMSSFGITTIRFSNNQIITNLEDVIAYIETKLP